jgi:uncharacterized damage-inducible protein DinB
LDELDERGLLPERVYAKEELLGYLDHARAKWRVRIGTLTGEEAARRYGFEWLALSEAEILLYTLRHTQHHAGQLNMLIAQQGSPAPRCARRGGGEYGIRNLECVYLIIDDAGGGSVRDR